MTPSTEQSKAFYRALRLTPLERFKQPGADKHIDNYLSGNELWKKSTADEKARWRQQVRFLARAAHNCAEDVFVASMCAGEIPPIRLTSEEQELLKAGFIPLGLPPIKSGPTDGQIIPTGEPL